MKRILIVFRSIPFTQILLLAIAALLYMNLQEQRNTTYKVNELDDDLVRYSQKVLDAMPGGVGLR